MRISNVQSDVDFRLYIDPWQFYLSNDLGLSSDTFLEASIKDKPRIVLPKLPRKGWIRSVFDLVIGSSESKNTFTGISALELECSDKIQLGIKRGQGGYPYKTLLGPWEIRLLDLQPGTDDMPLQGTIYHTTLERTVPYWAISYVWGDPSAANELITPEGNIRLTDSLHSAIKCLRNDTDHVFLWADAICINQDDNEEKAQQINMMSRIYNSAESVMAYLGDEANDSDLAFRTLLQITTRYRRPKVWPEFPPPIPESWGESYSMYISSKSIPTSAALWVWDD